MIAKKSWKRWNRPFKRPARAKYGHEHDIRAVIDRKSGDINLKRYREVVAEVENDVTQLPVGEWPDHAVGDFVIEDLPPIEFGRIAAQTAKQVIVQKVREAERQRQFREYKDRIGEIVNGIVKRVEYGNVTVDMGRARLCSAATKACRASISRTATGFAPTSTTCAKSRAVRRSFCPGLIRSSWRRCSNREVPEIYDSIITIKAVARDPGSRAKIAVISKDSSIDPVGACVGMRGSRVQAVVGELQGEKIDIIPWSNDPATFVVNALAPAEVSKVVLDEAGNRIEVVVPDDQLSLAIGRRGQNVRLASMLTGWDIDIMTEAEESERRQEEFKTRSVLFIEALEVDDVIAHLLITEGFASVEEIASTEVEELARIEGFDEDVAEELRNRAITFLEARDAAFEEERKTLGRRRHDRECRRLYARDAGEIGQGGREDARRSRRPGRGRTDRNRRRRRDGYGTREHGDHGRARPLV